MLDLLIRNMAQSTEDRVASLDDLDIVVDSDGHVLETLDDLLPYIDDGNEAIARQIKATDHPLSDIYTCGHALALFANTSVYTPSTADHNVDDPYGTEQMDADFKLSELADFGIDYSIMSASLNLGIHTINNDRIELAVAEAYNRWIVDTFLDEDDAIKGSILVAGKRPDRAAEQIDEWADEDDMVGVYFPPSALQFGPGDEFYDPVYEAAEDNGLPLILHSSSMAAPIDFPKQYMQMRTGMEQHVLAHSFTNQWSLISMICKGIPERFPDLEVVFQEAGISWVPYWKYRLDDHYMEYEHELPFLEKPPSEYMKDRFYFTTQPVGHAPDNPEHIAWAIEMAGPESVLWSADLPHPDFDTPDELFGKIRGHLTPEEVRAVMGENAADVFGLEA